MNNKFKRERITQEYKEEEFKKMKLIPNRRFKEFHESWEVRRIEELSDIVRGASPRPIDNPKWFDRDSDVGWLRIFDVTKQNGRIRHLEQRISKLGEEKTRVLQTPHLLLSIAATVGKPVINYVKTGVHDGFLIFKNPKFDLEYMYQWLEMFKDNWGKYGQPGSQVNLNSNIVKSKTLRIPKYKEQQKIGEFFKLLDARIANQKRKIEKIKALKQAYFTEMFPQEGEDIPKRRFEGFSEPWIKVKLANIMTKGGSGGTPLTSNPGYYNGGIPFLGISDITNSQGKIYETEKTITEEGLNSSAAWIVPKGAISLAMYASVGKVAILKIDSATSQAFYNLIIEKKETRDYVYHYLTKMELEGLWSKDISVGTQANLNAEKVKNLNIPMPKELKEREKVADFLTNLDDLLRIEKNKMSKLKKMKEAFLEEMFV